MIKMVSLIKRREGLSKEDFIKVYESNHRLIGEKYLNGYAVKYVRRYMFPIAHPATGEEEEPDYDVMMEAWFPDRAIFEEVLTILSRPEVAKEIVEDEARWFDRRNVRTYILEEHESNLK